MRGNLLPPMTVDVLVLGGGAAGMMCAITAARRGRRVLVLERNTKVGEKIRISGGGRCNFTNINAAPACYVSENPRFATSALSRFTPQDFLAWVEQHGIAWHEKTLGQLFCDRSSQQIIDMLVRELAVAGGELRLGAELRELTRDTTGLSRYRAHTSTGEILAESVVVATGGLSIPKLGATDAGYRIARDFGLPLVPPAPALVPFTWTEADAARYEGLSGISVDVALACNGVTFRENLLFTHRGLSGPAVLQISSYWNPGKIIRVNLAPELDLATVLLAEKAAGSRAEPATLLGQHLPKRVAQRWCALHGWQGALANQKDATLRAIARELHAWEVLPGGTEGYKKAEVTRGGVATAALSPKTLEAKSAPGLYFIGEVVDVTGWLGGYNFQWAWASGHAAGQAV